MIECLVNGELSTHVRADDRGLLYGDGVFETLAVFKGQPRFWQAHMERLARGARVLGFEPPSQALLLREVQTCSAGQQSCVVRITLSRGSGGRGYEPPSKTQPMRVVTAHYWPEQISEQQEAGITALTCELRLARQPLLAGLKHLNRLEQVLGAREVATSEFDTGMLCDQEGLLISALAGNVFLVLGTEILTPRLDQCGVRGVMRDAVMTAFKDRCEQRRISPDMLEEASEVFITNAVRGIIPVIRVDEMNYQPGPVTRMIQSWLADRTAS